MKKEICMVVNFEVGKTYRYNGKIGDPYPFTSLGIEKQDALFIVSGKPLMCTCSCVETGFSTRVGFKGMRREYGGWVFISLYHLFDEVKKKTVVKEEKKEMPKFEVGKKYRYTGSSGSVLDFIQIGIDIEDAEYLVSGEPLTVEFSKTGNRIKFKEFECPWSFFDTMLEKFEEVPTPKDYIARQMDWATRNDVKVGTKVRVTRSAETGEDGWGDGWVSSMDKKVGKIGTVECGIKRPYGLSIDFGEGKDGVLYSYPFFVLEVVKDTSVSKDKYIPVKKFETGKWYVCHLNERPSTWNLNGEMDGLLDGKPHKCIMGNETDASFEDIPLQGDGGWSFYCDMDYFEEVPSPVTSYSERQAEWIKKHNLKEGDKVTILRTAECREDGWCNDWVGSMNDMVGSSYTYNGAYDTGISLSCGFVWPYFVLDVVKEPTYRPYNNDELNSLVGKVLTQKGCGYPCLVTQRYSMTQVCVNGYLYNAQQLLELFALDGEPCGVREES